MGLVVHTPPTPQHLANLSLDPPPTAAYSEQLHAPIATYSNTLAHFPGIRTTSNRPSRLQANSDHPDS